MGRLVNAEWYAGYGPVVVLVNPRRVEYEIEAERRIHNRHHNLELYACAHTQAGIRPRQKLSRQCLDQPRRNDSALQGVLLQDPGIARIHEWNQ